ncbi:hypothetical protein TIFTF001_027624 [Ficus carica]|uniref:NB-ARC domain-containing protein n=1 Tax=Ficus carica TaxID=3494 RepID=A0AA88DNC5_FICCA|nr:hypothetical protein TIFTF001_027624 [Ficus carica]
MEQLQINLRQQIIEKRYLLVLDDVWSEDGRKWKELKDLLTANCSKGSRIIVTTRHHAVANVMSTKRPYDLGILDSEDSWNLFKKMADHEGKELSDQNMDIAKGILAKCAGLPLAIRQRIRSFLFPSKYFKIGDSKLDEAISNLKFLRTLDLSDGWIDTVPDSVGKLKHLRYLDLSESWIQTLPASITKLVNLQTLKLNWCNWLCELPSDIEKLVNLRHLELKGCDEITHMPRGLSQLTNLQTISLVVLSKNVPNGPYSKLDELMGMENLSGEVKIKGIISGMVTTASKLRENNRLRSLHLNFERREDDESKWKTTLEGLQPHPNLKVLSLHQYGGSSLSGFLSTLTNLVKLFLENCSKCQQLPSLDKFHSLKEMSLKTLPSLEYITINEGDNYFSTSSSPPVSVLPSLQKLTLVNLPEFRGWWRSGMTENQVEQLILPSFPRLSSLTIEGCKKLTSIPRYPNIEGELELRYSSWKTFEQTSKAEETSASSTTPRIVLVSSYPLSKLTYLRLSNVTDLEYFPDERMKGLASLKRVEIRDCPALKYLPPWIQYLTSLEVLEIRSCEKFEGIKWPETPTLPRLRVLKLKRLPKLKHLSSPGVQQHLTSLEALKIEGCEGLEEIKLTTALPRLRVLKLKRLPKLKDVFAPDIQCLTSLEELQIHNCEGLEEIKLTPALPRLRFLILWGLTKLKHLSSPGVQQHLTSLEALRIIECEELQVSNDDSIEWQSLTTLRFLYFKSLPQLVSLPWGLQFLTTLKQFHILDCPNFTGLPDWICKLSSLKSLYIDDCPKFKSVPASISSLTSLQMLRIHDKYMNPREIHEDLDLSCLASATGDLDGSTVSGSRSWKISKKFRVLGLCNK